MTNQKIQNFKKKKKKIFFLCVKEKKTKEMGEGTAFIAFSCSQKFISIQKIFRKITSTNLTAGPASYYIIFLSLITSNRPCLNLLQLMAIKKGSLQNYASCCCKSFTTNFSPVMAATSPVAFYNLFYPMFS